MPRLTKKAKKSAKRKRMHEEMSKYKRGTLRSSSGHKVTSREQAIAIGLSESGQSRKDKHGKMHHGHKRHSKARRKRGTKR